jgi:hypothetical protein
MIRANSSLVTWEFRRKRFGATTGLALARAVACDPIDSWWISTAAGLIFPAADVGFVGVMRGKPCPSSRNCVRNSSRSRLRLADG